MKPRLAVAWIAPLALFAFGCERGASDANAVQLFAPEGEAKGLLRFAAGEGTTPAMFAYLGEGLSQKGWRVELIDAPGADLAGAFRGGISNDACTAIGGFGAAGLFALDYAMAHEADGVDSVVTLATAFPDDGYYARHDFTIASVNAEFDPATPAAMILSLATRFPAKSTFYAIKGANRAGFAPGAEFADDGDASIAPDAQRAELVNGLDAALSVACKKRDIRLKEIARKAARRKRLEEAQRAQE